MVKNVAPWVGHVRLRLSPDRSNAGSIPARGPLAACPPLYLPYFPVYLTLIKLKNAKMNLEIKQKNIK